MSTRTPSAADKAIVAQVRDRLAADFAAALVADTPSVLETLEEHLAGTPDRDKWRPLKESIELVRSAAPLLEPRIVKHVRQRFDAKLEPGNDPLGKTQRFSVASLSLVADDEVQEEIAIGNAARRLREAVVEELYGLTERLAWLLGVERLSDDRNPAFPRTFARALLDAMAESSSDVSGRLAAFSAYSPALLNAVPVAYRKANALLRECGVLPDLARTYGTPQQVGGGPRTAALARGGLASGAPEPREDARASALFDRLIAGAASMGSGSLIDGLAAGGPAPAEAGTPAQSPGAVTMQVRPELARALQALEARLADGSLAAALASPGQSPAPAPARTGGPEGAMPGNLVRLAKDEMAAMLSPADGVVADLVAAMFDRLLSNGQLSPAARAQVSRLQLPVFRAAMADKRFFTDSAHPIRRLIDTMAELGAGDADVPIEGRTPGEWLVSETQTLLDANPSDTHVFAQARDRLAALAARHHDAQDEVDEVVALLKQEESHLCAVQDASLEMAHRIGAAHCPEAAAAFAYRAWRPVLVHDHEKAGQGSPQWVADLETLEDMLWTLTPRITETERLRLTTLLPSLRYRMKQGLLRSGLTRPDADTLMEQMRRIHGELERAPAAAALGELRIMSDTGPGLEDDVTATLNLSSAALEEEGLARGSWYEFTEADGGRRRCRLSWLSPIQGACVFKDLARNRSFAIALDDLRTRRAQGLARPVDGPGVAGESIEAALQDVARERGAAPGQDTIG